MTVSRTCRPRYRFPPPSMYPVQARSHATAHSRQAIEQSRRARSTCFATAPSLGAGFRNPSAFNFLVHNRRTAHGRHDGLHRRRVTLRTRERVVRGDVECEHLGIAALHAHGISGWRLLGLKRVATALERLDLLFRGEALE